MPNRTNYFYSFLFLSVLLISCEDKKTPVKYVKAKLLEYCYYNSDDTIDYCSEWRWNGNIVKIYKNNQLLAQRTYNDYGFLLENKEYDTDGTLNYMSKYEIKDKWKITKQEVFQNDSYYEYNHSWVGNVETESSGDRVFYETEWDNYARIIKRTYFRSNGEIYHEDNQVWDEKYRWRGLYGTRSTYKNIDNPNGYYYEITWDGDSNVYTRYDSNGNIHYTSTQTVNEYDQALIRDYSDEDGKYRTWEYGETFKAYGD
jgi:hypothetical protein